MGKLPSQGTVREDRGTSSGAGLREALGSGAGKTNQGGSVENAAHSTSSLLDRAGSESLCNMDKRLGYSSPEESAEQADLPVPNAQAMLAHHNETTTYRGPRHLGSNAAGIMSDFLLRLSTDSARVISSTDPPRYAGAECYPPRTPLDDPLVDFSRIGDSLLVTPPLTLRAMTSDGFPDTERQGNVTGTHDVGNRGHLDPVINADQFVDFNLHRGMRMAHIPLQRSSELYFRPSSAILFERPAADTSPLTSTPRRLRYLPLHAEPAGGTHRGIARKMSVPADARLKLAMVSAIHSEAAAIWPGDRVPVEIVRAIASFLSREGIKALRLVNKDFERKISPLLFRTSVVLFNTELYDMIGEHTRNAVQQELASVNGKAKAKAVESSQLQWPNAKNDSDGKVYRGQGLKVFQGFGRHIIRFGLNFEVTEEQLLNPPAKTELVRYESYFGSYDWPKQQYTRFANLAGLEDTADERSRMKDAFSHLKAVKELGLSIDSGLGWLAGADRSMHARIFQRPSNIFRSDFSRAGHHAQELKNFWNAIRWSYRDFGNNWSFAEQVLYVIQSAVRPSTLIGLPVSAYSDSSLWPTVDPDNVDGNETGIPPHGVIMTSRNHSGATEQIRMHKVRPNDLNKGQKEWLLETEWAQRAFLESYLLAVIDTPDNFFRITVLNVSKISSGLLVMLERQRFWDALPSVSDVTVLVSPDWRSVHKDVAGWVQAPLQYPSGAVNDLHRLVASYIKQKPSITKLHIGYTAGGEHAEGIFARNKHVLPAPMARLEQRMFPNPSSMLLFPYVKQLTLSNCWMTPPALERLIRTNALYRLRKITLKSFSLTALPGSIIINNESNATGVAAAGGPAMQAQTFANSLTAHAPSQPSSAQAAPSTGRYRPGSWPLVLDALSTRDSYALSSCDTTTSTGMSAGRLPTSLCTVKLKSVGYVLLPDQAGINQQVLQADEPHRLSAWFNNRARLLAPVMMWTEDPSMGKIVQYIPREELNALHQTWGITEGWNDVVAADGAWFDGLLRGGTGRITGTVHRDFSKVHSESESDTGSQD